MSSTLLDNVTPEQEARFERLYRQFETALDLYIPLLVHRPIANLGRANIEDGCLQIYFRWDGTGREGGECDAELNVKVLMPTMLPAPIMEELSRQLAELSGRILSDHLEYGDEYKLSGLENRIHSFKLYFTIPPDPNGGD